MARGSSQSKHDRYVQHYDLIIIINTLHFYITYIEYKVVIIKKSSFKERPNIQNYDYNAGKSNHVLAMVF